MGDPAQDVDMDQSDDENDDLMELASRIARYTYGQDIATTFARESLGTRTGRTSQRRFLALMSA